MLCPPRIRVYPGTATVYVDAANGVDTNDGTCAYSASNPPGVGPVKSLQLAVDMASANFDVGTTPSVGEPISDVGSVSPWRQCADGTRSGSLPLHTKQPANP